MKTSLKWITDALSAKDLTHGMAHYRIANNEIRATDGRIIAGHPWPGDGTYVVPGAEFEKLLARMPDEPAITVNENSIAVRSGRYHGTINTLSPDKWQRPGVEDAKWLKLPKGLPDALKALRPFISDNAMQLWADCVALENGWAYATNNVALAGVNVPSLGSVMALLPSWAVDFVLSRVDGLSGWAWTEHYVAFKWDNGAWMRSTLVVGQFPEKAAELVRASAAEKPTQEITKEFRSAFNEVAHMAEDVVRIYGDRMEAGFQQATIVAEVESEVPAGQQCSIWGATYLVPAINAATHWSPARWPAPAPFRGKVVSGYVVGRRQ